MAICEAEGCTMAICELNYLEAACQVEQNCAPQSLCN